MVGAGEGGGGDCFTSLLCNFLFRVRLWLFFVCFSHFYIIMACIFPNFGIKKRLTVYLPVILWHPSVTSGHGPAP